MKEFDFCKGINLPKDKYIVIVRDKKIYYTWGACELVFEMFAGLNGKDIEKFAIKNSDVIYVCPTAETYYECISRGICLDKFKLDSENRNRELQVKTYLQNYPNNYVGRRVGGGKSTDKYRIVLMGDELRCIKPDGLDYCRALDFSSPGMSHFTSDNMYEFFSWLNNKEQ